MSAKEITMNLTMSPEAWLGILAGLTIFTLIAVVTIIIKNKKEVKK